MDIAIVLSLLVLAIIAFIAWALGTSSAIAKSFALDPSAGTFILGVLVFLIPGIDQFLIKKGW